MLNFTDKIGDVPRDWNIVNAKKHLLLESGMRPSEYVTDFPDDIPSLGGENIREDGYLVFKNVRYISKDYYRRMPKGKICDLDILINKDGANTGKLAFVKRKPYPECAVNEHLFIVRNTGDFYQYFLFYFLLARKGNDQIVKKVVGSAQGGINSSFPKGIALPLPPFPEQKAIAGILSKVDEAIEAVEDSIKAADRLKKSLMQNLLTGKLTPDGRWRSEGEFCVDDKFGKVPKGWTVKRLKDLILFHQYGMNISSSDSGTVPMFRMNNIIDGRMVDSPMVMVNISNSDFEKYKVEKGDILFNRTNSLDLVGKIGIFDMDGDYVFASYLIRIRATEDNEPEYLNYYLNSYKGQTSLRAKATPAVSQANINAKSLVQTYVPRPPKETQTEIVRLIKSHEDIKLKHAKKLQALKTLKKALMQNLLIGKVRVDVEKINKLLEEV